MLWVKALHIVFVASWFAGLFYLPRIFVNLAMVPAGSIAENERLLLMARKLLRFTTILSIPALGFGLWLWLGYGIGRGPGNGWLHAKLAVVLLAVGYHHACGVLLRKLRGWRQPARPPVVPMVQRGAGPAAARCRRARGRQAVLSSGGCMVARKTSAWPLAQAYAALVVYASLYPFTGWRDQGIPSFAFLGSPWPKYWTGFDVAANVVGYAPLGFLLA
jgi:putative membrane protein